MALQTQTLDGFLKHHKILGKSPKTIEAYQRDLTVFVSFLIDLSDRFTAEQKEAMESLHFYQAWSFCGQFKAWQTVSVEDIKNFIGFRMQAGIAARSIARQLSAIRSLFDYLLQEGVVLQNPAKGVKAPKQPKPLPKSLDVDLTQTLLDQPVNANDWQAVRNQAIFELLYSSALRVSECADLDLSPGLDQLADGWLQVLGKGSKERLTPLGAQAMAALKAWLALRTQHAKEGETAVFVNRSGSRLGVRSIQKELDKRTLEAGLPTKMSPHRLRHACATHVLESSGDLRAVQEMLGHANLSTTQIYTKLDLQHLATVYDSAHPRAKKK